MVQAGGSGNSDGVGEAIIGLSVIVGTGGSKTGVAGTNNAVCVGVGCSIGVDVGGANGPVLVAGTVGGSNNVGDGGTDSVVGVEESAVASAMLVVSPAPVSAGEMTVISGSCVLVGVGGSISVVAGPVLVAVIADGANNVGVGGTDSVVGVEESVSEGNGIAARVPVIG